MSNVDDATPSPESGPSPAPGSPVGMHVPDPTPPPDATKSNASKILVLSLVPVVATFLIFGIMSVSIYASETAGVFASTIGVPIIAFVWSGFIGTSLAIGTGDHNLQTKIGAGLGCGCMGSLMLFLMVGFFFVGIFPAL